ncbi:MAG: prepilin-type N-terminal cleavage/methylation domain-containing protein [Bacteriovoracaceae bacterium]|nr:prepilin-type N-terminal cleavage/methylation domain-containing protein [Bacteriovoracaceae bacterium]
MKRNTESGFTLLEILMAIMVLSIMMVLVFDMSSTSTETVERVMAEDREYMQVQTAFAIIDRDFSSYYTPLFTEVPKKQNPGESSRNDGDNERFDGVTHMGKLIPIVDNQEKHELIFMTSSNKRRLQGIKQSNFAWVRYTLRPKEKNSNDEDEDGPKGEFELVRQYSADDPYSPSFEWDQIKSNILLRNVTKFQFYFWDNAKEDFVESISDISEKQKVVRLIRVNLTWINRNGFKIETNRSFRAMWYFHDASKEISTSPPNKNSDFLYKAKDDEDEDDK